MPDRDRLRGHDHGLVRAASDRAATATDVAKKEHAGAREDGEKETDDDEEPTSTWSRSCWS